MQLRALIPIFFLAAMPASGQVPAPSQANEAPVPQQHAHGDFMHEGMHHLMAKGVRLEAKTDAASHTMTVRVGPMNFPARTPHGKMPQPADLIWDIPLTGWLLAYHARLVDAKGGAVPGTVLHHVAFWNENRPDFLCSNKDEHIFGAGGELTDWAPVPGYGYRVQKGDRIRVETMIHNPTATAYSDAYLEVAIPYLDDASPAPVKNFYPAWMDAAACGNSGYDLPAGPSEKAGNVTVKYDGVMLGVGGHLHDYGKQVVLENATRKETVATLAAKTDKEGRLLSVPVVLFLDKGGYKLAAGDRLKITATYDNPTGHVLREGAMGIVVGDFVPANDAAFAALRHAAKPERHDMEHMHDMPGMDHDHH